MGTWFSGIIVWIASAPEDSEKLGTILRKSQPKRYSDLIVPHLREKKYLRTFRRIGFGPPSSGGAKRWRRAGGAGPSLLLFSLLFLFAGCSSVINQADIPSSPSPAEEVKKKKQPAIFHLRVITLSTFEDAVITHAELKSGVPFHLIAAQRSIGPSADLGGYLGEVDLEKLRPEIRKLVENLKVGEMSEIGELDGTFSVYFRTADEHFRKGLEHNRQKNYLDAVEALKRDVALNPDNFNGWLALGNAYGGLNRVEDAISAYKEATKVNPANPKPYNNLAIFFTQQNRLDEATNMFRIALSYNANDDLVLTNLAAILVRQEKELNEAQALMEQALNLKPRKAAYHGLFAAIQEKQGKRELTRNSLRRAVELDPENPLFRARLESLKILISKTRKSKSTATNALPKSEIENETLQSLNGGAGAAAEKGRLAQTDRTKDILSSKQPAASPGTASGSSGQAPEVLTSRPDLQNQPSGTGQTSSSFEDFSIQVLNGNGVRGSAGRWAMHLLSLGLPAHEIGNSPKNDYETTIIYYKPGAENMAIEVRRAFDRKVFLQGQTNPGKYDIIVVVGRDAEKNK